MMKINPIQMKHISRFFVIILFLTSVLSNAQELSSSSRKAKKLYEEATYHIQYEQYFEAKEKLLKAIATDANFYEAYLMLGDLHADMKEPQTALRYYKEAVALNKDFYPQVHYFIGRLYMDSGDYAGAELAFQQFLSYPDIDDYSKRNAQRQLLNCQFATVALQNPVDFEPLNMGPNINSVYYEYFPSMNVEGNYLLYTRRLGQEGHHQQEDFYASITNKYGEWVPSQNLGNSINTPLNEGAASLSADGTTLIFTACEQNPGNYGPQRQGYGSCDLFFARRKGNAWSKAINLGPPINTNSWESQPSLSSDGETLYFVRAVRRGQHRESDILVSHIDEEGYWTVPKKLSGVINTELAEESVFIHPDNNTLYFSSRGHVGMGGSDIYMSKRNDQGQWDSAINLGYPINTHKDENSLLVGPDGEIGYFASDRDGGFGGLDLYAFSLPETIKADPVTFFKGVVYDSLSGQLLSASLELLDLESGDLVASGYSKSSTGAFFLTLSPNNNYIVNVSKKGYLFYSDGFFIQEGHSQLKPFEKDIPLLPIEVGSSIVLKNVFFETDKSNLKAQSQTELQKLFIFLDKNPSLSIEIAGHTDNVGGYDHNVDLSKKRAQAVYDFLLEKGIEAKRLKYKGYSYDKPVGSNDTPEGRAKNRRTEFTVIAI